MPCKRMPLEDWPINEGNDGLDRMRTCIYYLNGRLEAPTVVALGYPQGSVLWREITRGCGTKMQRRSAPTARGITSGAFLAENELADWAQVQCPMSAYPRVGCLLGPKLVPSGNRPRRPLNEHPDR